MEWNHLPVAGGIYDQHPKLIEQFRILFSERAKHEEKKRKDQEAKQKRDQAKAGGRRGRRR